MKGVNNKVSSSKTNPKSADSKTTVKASRRKRSESSDKVLQPITASQMLEINQRLDDCLPMETPEWCRLEQLLMQMTEFAPTDLVYEIGMAAAVYSDNQAHRAYIVGAEDALAEPVKKKLGAAKAQKSLSSPHSKEVA